MFECLGWGGGGLNEKYPSPPHPQNLIHIYDTLTFMFECQGWGVVISHLTPQLPHPQNLSHIYDTLTFMFECQGWGGGGLNEKYPSPPHPQNLIHIYDTLTFMFECQGWGVVISHLTPHHLTPKI